MHGCIAKWTTKTSESRTAARGVSEQQRTLLNWQRRSTDLPRGPLWFRYNVPRSLGTRWQGLESQKRSDVRAALDHRLSEIESLVGTVACCMFSVAWQVECLVSLVLAPL